MDYEANPAIMNLMTEAARDVARVETALRDMVGGGIMTAVASTERTVAEVVCDALAADAVEDEDRRWELVSHLHLHGGESALRAAERLCHSQVAAHRKLGVDILGQLGAAPDRPASQGPFRDAAVRILLDVVVHEDDPAILAAIGIGFGHLEDVRAIAPLAQLHTHPDPEVRDAVVFGLLGYPQRAALDILIQLSADPDSHVRDWATFGLARQTNEDFEELRYALAARTSDPDLDTRAEALLGLSTRGDPRAIHPLLEALAAPWPGSDPNLIDEALYALAAATADRQLCKHITAHRDRWRAACPDEPLPDDLQAAIARCTIVEPND